MGSPPPTFAFQGERGAFSEEAGHRFFAARLGAGALASPQRTFDEMFAAVASGAVDCALAPIENTLAGSIIKNYDLLVDNDLTIVGEVILRVVHNLIAAPGVELPDIKRVHSHPVALAQCERFLNAHPQIEVLPAYDTAGSVKMIMDGGRRDEAAIAGQGAAAAWGAHVVRAGIESSPQNFTRFFVLARPDRGLPVWPDPPAGERKTSIVFRIGNQPGALYRALAAFAEGNIDLTKIESRPIEGRPWEYSFYIDFIGDRSDPVVAGALAKLVGLAESVRILGSYPRAAPV